MASNFLQLNADKTEVLIVDADSIDFQVASCTASLNSNAEVRLQDIFVC